MRIEAPFYVPFIIADCSFIEEIYSDLNAVIMAEHNKKPFEVEGSHSYDKQLKQDITESAPNFHTNQDHSVQKLFQWFNSTICQFFVFLVNQDSLATCPILPNRKKQEIN